MARFLVLLFFIVAMVSTANARSGSQIYGSGIPNSLRQLLKNVLTKDWCYLNNVMNQLDSALEGEILINVPDIDDSHRFFMESDLYSDNQLKVALEPSGVLPECAFLPRSIADSIPFSSNHFDEILDKFSVPPNSAYAHAINETISLCELPELQGEGKMCTTSLEAMEEFVWKTIGREAEAATTTVKDDTTRSRTLYTVTKWEKMLGKNQMSCHRLSYPYAVHYCHLLTNTAVYKLLLAGDKGISGEAMALCHLHTSVWIPDISALMSIDMESGKGAICHLLRKGHLLWTAAIGKAET